MFECVFIKEKAANWEDAIRMAAEPLLAGEAVNPAYVDAMIASVKKNGFYIVIAEGVAMPHARPEDGVSRTALTFMKLNRAVMFGDNEVFILIALAAADSTAHIESLTKIAGFLDNPERVAKIKEITNENELQELIKNALK